MQSPLFFMLSETSDMNNHSQKAARVTFETLVERVNPC
jgi:hypothetical protein